VRGKEIDRNKRIHVLSPDSQSRNGWISIVPRWSADISCRSQCLKYGGITAQMGRDKLNVGSDKTHVGQ